MNYARASHTGYCAVSEAYRFHICSMRHVVLRTETMAALHQYNSTISSSQITHFQLSCGTVCASNGTFFYL